ncbi:MAG: hypothetical protein AAFU79_05725 [Myxococcota bacterium]
MTAGKDRKPSPLWKLMPARAYVPPTGPRPAEVGFVRPSRDVGEPELRPLRVDDDWRVVRILDLLPAAETPQDALPLLLVAASVTQGPGRVYELADKARGTHLRSLGRVEGLLAEPAAHRHGDFLARLVEGGRLALTELGEVRTRADNDRDPDVSRPYGLRLLDLLVLVDHVGSAIGAHEVARRAHPAGVSFARALVEAAPEPDFAETWVERLMGSPLRGVRLFWPREYDRLLLVFDDGRLAYDPAGGIHSPDL